MSSAPVLEDPALEPEVEAAAVTSASQAELEAYGLAGLRGVVDRLRRALPDLPARERVQAISAEGRLHATLATLEQRAADSRQEYLESAEFREDAKLLAAALAGSAGELRAALARLGVNLPAPPTLEVKANRSPPRTVADVEALALELVEAARMRDLGEAM